MIEDVIKYLENTYQITTDDLIKSSHERNYLAGQLAMLDEIKDLLNKGIPKKDSK